MKGVKSGEGSDLPWDPGWLTSSVCEQAAAWEHRNARIFPLIYMFGLEGTTGYILTYL